MARARSRRSPRARRPRTPWSVRLLKLLLVLLLLGAAGGVAGAVWLWPRCEGDACPSVEALRSYAPPQASRVFDARGRVVAHLAPERRIVIPLERVPGRVAGAFLAVEDKRFFRHAGVDYRRVAGAMLRNLQSGGFAEGFSTVTMQLARNVFPEHLSRAKTLRRKAWEVVLARRIERAFSKDEILEMYLNQIYLGEGLYGVEAAAHGYFGKSTRELNPAEAAMLAALPKAPSAYNPRRNPAAAVRRRNLVLALMAEGGVIEVAEAERWSAEPLRLVPPLEAQGEAPYFVAAVRRELRQRFGAEADNAGLRVYTGLDVELQDAAEAELRRQIEAVEAGQFGRYRAEACGGAGAAGRACLQGLFVALDARTGDVRALVGGRDYALSQFDRVTQAKRQAGSAFKPFVYAAGLARGVPIPTVLVGPGAPDFEGGYLPADHVADSAGIDLREGLRASSNRAAVALGERVGVGEVVRTAQALGLSTPIPAYPSTFLGAADVVPLELVAAYSAFANQGVLVRPRLVQRVENARGEVLWQQPVEARAVLSPEVAFLTNTLLRDVVDRGTGYAVRREGLPHAVPALGKTGTTNEAADVWFVGATPELVAGVWLGFDRPKRILHGASGGSLAAPVWGRVLGRYYRERPAPADWAAPPGVVSVMVDAQTGQLATGACPPEQVRAEWYLTGTEPVEQCALHHEGVEGWFRRALRGLGDIFQ